MKNIESLLFLCNHNVIRSVMAEHIFKLHFKKNIYCASAGVSVGVADSFVSAVMAELGVDLKNHVPKMLGELARKEFDLIITHSPQAHHVALSMDLVKTGRVLYWAAADPTVVEGSREQRLAAYRGVRDSIGVQIREFFLN